MRSVEEGKTIKKTNLSLKGIQTWVLDYINVKRFESTDQNLEGKCGKGHLFQEHPGAHSGIPV